MATNVSANRSQGAVSSGCFSLFASNPDEKYGHLTPATGTIKIVDVVNDYPWTVNQPDNRPETPCIELIEYQVGTSMLIMQLQYYKNKLNSSGEGLASLLAERAKGVVNATAALSVDLVEGVIPGVESEFGENVQNLISNILPTVPADELTGKSVDPQPLSGLYQAVSTGFRYNLPLFTKTLRSIQNTWGSEQSVLSSVKNVGDAFSAATGANSLAQRAHWVTSLASAFGTAMELALPGAKIEMPEYWNATESQGIPITFTLLNTISHEQTVKNWELVFLLTHQTLHFRKNFIVNHSPCLYQVNIPGILNYPVCAATEFKVNGLGTTRKISICNTTKLIPEAYQIGFELVPLTQDSRNQNIYNMSGSSQDIVRVIDPIIDPTVAEVKRDINLIGGTFKSVFGID